MTVHKDAICTFCGCLCDDLEVEVENNRISRVKNACMIGRNKLLHSQSNIPKTTISGRPVMPDEAISEAAGILKKARSPLVYGLSSTTTEAQREMIAIAELTGASLDNPSSYCHGPGVIARQQVGMSSCTLGEVKNRADLVIFWGCNPIEAHVRHFTRYSVSAKGLFMPEGRKGRKIVAIDIRPTPTTRSADWFIQVTPGKTFEIATVLRALVSGRPPGIKDNALIGGVPFDTWRKLVETIKGCNYGVIFFGLGVTQCRGRDINVEQLSVLVSEINNHTRFYAMAMRGHGNVAGCNQVMTWQTGYPIAVNFSRGYPRYNPGEFSVIGLLARKEADAALIVATDPGSNLPADVVDYLKQIPTVYLEPHINPATKWATVVIPVAQAGVAASGTFYRMDNVALKVKKLVESDLLSDEEVLKRLRERIAHAQDY